MMQSFATIHNRRISFGLLFAAGILVACAAVIGLDDNWAGVALAYLAAALLITGFVHPWRSAREFLWLAFGTVPAFAILVVVHNFAEALAEGSIVTGALHGILAFTSVAAFAGAVFVCPPACAIGLIGALASFSRRRRTV